MYTVYHPVSSIVKTATSCQENLNDIKWCGRTGKCVFYEGGQPAKAGTPGGSAAAQAYVSAVCNAIGAPITEYPLTPDKVLEAIEKKNKKG